jgi:hypothetical protein
MNHTIPNSLIGYQQALEKAIRREIAGAAASRRRRRVWIRFALASGATAAVALGALSLLVSGAPSRVAPAAAAVIHRAAAALAGTPGTILHIKFTATQDNGNGTTVSWSQETFDEQESPYDSRMVNVQLPGTPRGVEQATVAGAPELYDPTRNTIYVGPPPSGRSPETPGLRVPAYRFDPGPTPGTYTVQAPLVFIGGSSGARSASVAGGSARTWRKRTIWRIVVVTAAQAKALRKGRDIIRWKIQGRGTRMPRITDARVVPGLWASSASTQTDPADVNPFSPAFRGQILALLGSGDAEVVGHSTVDGRDTLEIRSRDGHIVYYVAQDTYRPVELTTRGTSGATTMRFTTYEELPVNDNTALLSLTAQHPSATIDRNVAEYAAAQARLFPHG